MPKQTVRMTKLKSNSKSPAPAPRVPRKVVVLGSLLGMVTLTCGLLLVLAPAPLAPAAGLLAEQGADPLDAVYDAVAGDGALRPWRFLYVHQAGAKGTSGAGDHFVIGDGRDGEDGEIRVTERWQRQRPALPPPGASGIDSGCVSICLGGDLDRRPPTAAQVRSLAQLVGSLSRRLDVGTGGLVMLDGAAGSPAGVGRRFDETRRAEVRRAVASAAP